MSVLLDGLLGAAQGGLEAAAENAERKVLFDLRQEEHEREAKRRRKLEQQIRQDELDFKNSPEYQAYQDSESDRRLKLLEDELALRNGSGSSESLDLGDFYKSPEFKDALKEAKAANDEAALTGDELPHPDPWGAAVRQALRRNPQNNKYAPLLAPLLVSDGGGGGAEPDEAEAAYRAIASKAGVEVDGDGGNDDDGTRSIVAAQTELAAKLALAVMEGRVTREETIDSLRSRNADPSTISRLERMLDSMSAEDVAGLRYKSIFSGR